ncbi:MAG TPA: HAMP domain-containing sensor histidine kinase [Solirubrobacteraceae bacterium]|nr:HAMP domain-containing sensor histidine kinase [Solirubrobacteraceae bacterium]
MSLRRRVLAYVALAAIASCALTTAVAVVLVRHRIAAQRVTALRTEAGVLSVVGGAPGALAVGDHVYRIGTGRPRRVRPAVARAVADAIGSTGDSEGSITVAGRSLLYVARTTSRGRVVLIRSARLAFAEWRPFLSSLVIAGLGGAVLAAILSFLLARRLLRPIDHLAAATRRVASGETGVTVPVEGEDELAALGRSFNTMAAELTQAREAQRAFLESVSHELKTPLTSIRGYAEALEEGAVSPAEGGRVVAAEADRLQQLVFDLLDLARLGRAGFAVEHGPVDLAAIAAAAVRRHLPRAQELAVTLTATGDDGAWGIADDGRLLQATSNLVENALRMTPEGGSVEVHAAPATITVSDTGPGLAAEDLPRAFERFYLYDRYRSERAVGSGLGLAIVKELAAAMGGTVTASGRPGGGAEFQIRIPAADHIPTADIPHRA